MHHRQHSITFEGSRLPILSLILSISNRANSWPNSVQRHFLGRRPPQVSFHTTMDLATGQIRLPTDGLASKYTRPYRSSQLALHHTIWCRTGTTTRKRIGTRLLTTPPTLMIFLRVLAGKSQFGPPPRTLPYISRYPFLIKSSKSKTQPCLGLMHHTCWNEVADS